MVKPIENFSFTQLPRIFFGPGTIKQLSNLLNAGGKVLLVTGKKSFDTNNVGLRVMSLLKSSDIGFLRYTISGEPSPVDIDKAIKTFATESITTVISIGGGSVIDAGKAIAAMFCEVGSIRDYLEGIGTKKPSGKRLKLVAIPTTSGTGSEATKNAVISEFGQNGFKKSLRHDNFIPDAAIVDPELIVGCPSNITGSSGMDAFTQLLESYLSVKSNPITDSLAFSGLEYIAGSLKKAYSDGHDIYARTNMAYAALMSGVCLANAGLGLVHGFAQPLGSLFPMPHGTVCGTMMSAVNRQTVIKLKAENDGFGSLKKYAAVGKLFSQQENMDDNYYINILLDTIDEYSETFKIARLSDFGITKNDFGSITERTEMKNHPVNFTNDELDKILENSL